jgi:hypothetical protein
MLPYFPKRFLEDSQALPVCPSDNMKLSMEHVRKDVERGASKLSEKSLPDPGHSHK